MDSGERLELITMGGYSAISGQASSISGTGSIASAFAGTETVARPPNTTAINGTDSIVITVFHDTAVIGSMKYGERF